MSLGMTIVFLLYTIYRYLHNKPTIALLMGWMIVSPCIRIGGISFDSTYLVVIILFIAIFFIRGGIIIPKNEVIKYIFLLFGVNVLFVISWLLFNRNDPSTTFTDFFGVLKISILLVESLTMNYEIAGISYKKQIEAMIWAIAIINVLAVFYEMLDFNGSISFLSNNVFNDGEVRYLESQTKWGQYQRYFGLFGYPMKLGMFSIYALSFVNLTDCVSSKTKKIFLMAILIFLGLASSSKSFILGTAILLVSYIILCFFGAERTRSTFFSGAIALITLLIIGLLFTQISDLIAATLGSNAAKYFDVLKDVSEIFRNRFDSESGMLATSNLYEVIRNNLIFGVGSSSISGEPVMDNAFLVIIHNGGLVAIVIVIGYYMRLILKCRRNRANLIMLVIILATGMGFQTWIAATSAWLIVWAILAPEGNIKQ